VGSVQDEAIVRRARHRRRLVVVLRLRSTDQRARHDVCITLAGDFVWIQMRQIFSCPWRIEIHAVYHQVPNSQSPGGILDCRGHSRTQVLSETARFTNHLRRQDGPEDWITWHLIEIPPTCWLGCQISRRTISSSPRSHQFRLG
jgi:hypothetical protein